jgi:RNAse H-fold protein YqgF
MTRVLGLDVGDQRIGVAISDELRFTTRGLLTIKRTNAKEDIQKIADLAGENNCSDIVVGLPLNLSGDDSKQTEKVRLFAKKLENKFGNLPKAEKINVILSDERFSTKIADEIMDEVGISKSKKREIIDQQAACIILEDWIASNPEMS